MIDAGRLSRLDVVLRRQSARIRTDVMAQKVAINVLILAVIWTVLVLLQPRFLTVENLTNVLRQISVIATVGSAVTLLMVSRNFDLSVGGTVALAGCLAATLAGAGVPIPVAFAAGTLVGAGIGLANGVLTVVFGINSVVVTLGTLYLTRGSALLVTGGVPVYNVPVDYSFLGAGYVGLVPIPVIIMALIVLGMTIVERRTLLGKHARATGSGPLAARLVGVRTRRTQLILFVLAGAAAGWGGIMTSSRVGGGIPSIGEGLEFSIIVAAVLGGTSLAGGQGLVVGTFMGALLIGTLNNGLNLLGVPSFWQTVTLGVVLVVAVLLDVGLRASVRQRSRGLRRDDPQGASAIARSAQ